MNPSSGPRRWVSLGGIIGAPPPLRYPRDGSFHTAPQTQPETRTPEQEAADRTARAAGYIPLETVPKDKYAGWRCKCATCGALRRPSLAAIERGTRCRHSNGGRPPAP
ncbi:hypothetical protein [Streptomyces sp. Tu6071]|uniref:hypothetical protein n=1 Tax=Streptomyces sp. Tu6071 TaxID=355249 RepID=UPI00131A14F9|nr:hypothetical protein [Streptomyces sp. Tu6071]